LGDIAIKQNTLPPDLDDQLFQIFNFHDVAHLNASNFVLLTGLEFQGLGFVGKKQRGKGHRQTHFWVFGTTQ
jgi:hypothetical protein